MGGSPSFEMHCRFEVETTSSTSRTDYLPRRTKNLKRLSLSFKTSCGFEAIATYDHVSFFAWKPILPDSNLVKVI